MTEWMVPNKPRIGPALTRTTPGKGRAGDCSSRSSSRPRSGMAWYTWPTVSHSSSSQRSPSLSTLLGLFLHYCAFSLLTVLTLTSSSALGVNGDGNFSNGVIPLMTYKSPSLPSLYHTGFYRSNDTQGEGPRKEIWLLGLFPFNGSWPGGLGQLPAITMGLEDVNNDPNILPGYKLSLTINNTGCDAGMGTNALFQQLYNKPVKIMVLGAGCSAVSQATAQASHLWNLIQLSYSSASPSLSDKNTYKRFFRVFPPESSFNPAKFDLLAYFNWKKVGTLHEADEIFALTTTDFLEKAPSRGIKVLTSESFATDPRQQVRNLKKHGARIIIGNFYENKARVIFCEAYKEKMYGSKYVWIITGFYTPMWWRKTDPENLHDCTMDQLEKAVQGYFTADALPLSLSNIPGISGKTYQEFTKMYNKRTKGARLTGHQEAPYGYDSVWSVAVMLNYSLAYFKRQNWNRTVEDFTYQDVEMANVFHNMINGTTFQGVSGPVMFDENGDRKGLTQIEQLQKNKEMRVGVYDPSLKRANKITWEKDRPVVWIDGHPPPDSIVEVVVPRVISLGLFVTMTVLAALGIVLTCLFLVFNIRYRHRKYIKMSSPNMNNIILFGALLAFTSIIFAGTDSSLVSPAAHLIMCKFYNWTLALGFSLAFGAMFSKTWRVHKIFTNKKIQRMVIKDYQLMAIVCVLVALDVLVLTIWEFTDPLHITFYNKTLEAIPDPENDNQVLIPQTRFCESPHIWYFAGIIYGIKGLLLVFGAFLAFETRKVTVPALNDSKFIGISVYNVMVLCLIGVPIALMMKEQVDAAYALISVFILFATTLTICLVFIPKIIHRNKEPHSGTLWNKTADSATTAKKPMIPGTCLTDVERREVDRLREENNTLRESLDQCHMRIRELESSQLNGMSPKTLSDEILPTELLTPDSVEHQS